MFEALVEKIKEILGILELEQQVVHLKRRLSAVERRLDDWFFEVEEKLSELGDYKRRSGEELARMRDDIQILLGSVDHLIGFLESQADIQRTKRLITRLKKNRGHIDTALAALKARGG